jgi:O-acetyl-ADP-ribose deacetylase (regulator of RNase III)
MIEYARGDILKADAEALVNSVNCVGVMGRGLALQFKQAFPQNFKAYKAVCERGDLAPGRVLVHDRGALLAPDTPRYIINVPTKTHWRPPSNIEYIEAGMQALRREVEQRAIRSVALPPLGCGAGGLDWPDVEAIMTAEMQALADVRVILYLPRDATRSSSAEPSAKGASTDRSPLTRGRALLLAGLDACAASGQACRMSEAQAVAYLLQHAGEPLQLTFRPSPEGPSARGVHRVLRYLDGRYVAVSGREDRTASIRMLPEAANAARAMCTRHPEASDRLQRVVDLVKEDGRPPHVEVLAAVLWVVQRHRKTCRNVHAAVQQVHALGRAARTRFPPSSIEAAWTRLHEQEWIPPNEDAN